LYDHRICLDHLPKPNTNIETNDKEKEDKGKAPCLVYDFGIRAQPEFGKTMPKVFGCEVHAFDPSPVSTKWWKSDASKDLRSMANYHFHPYGAWGFDGDLE